MRSCSPFLLAALSLALTACGGASPQPEALRSVVLYQNGVGHFSRTGVAPDGKVRLRVRAGEIDDVLATVTVMDRGAGPESRVSPAAVVPRPAEDEAAVADQARTLVLDLGEEGRDVAVTYATKTSAWRASYRVVLPDEGSEGAALLQGWAIIDNTTAEDWRDVELTLATEAPFSFAVDLRTPLLVDRPDVTGHLTPRVPVGPVFAEVTRGRVEPIDRDGDGILDEDDACPDEHEQFNGVEDDDGCPDSGRVMIQENRIVLRDGQHVLERAAPAVTAEGLRRTVGAAAMPRTEAAGTRYLVRRTVSVPAGASAMVAMVNETVQGEPVLLYRPDSAAPRSALHPFRAARFSVPDGTDLVPGPVALYGGGDLLGQGLIEAVDAAGGAVVPYGLDTSTAVARTTEVTSRPVRIVAVDRGTVTLLRDQIETTTHRVLAGARAPARMWIHFSLAVDEEPIDPPEGSVRGDGAVLVPLSLSPSGATELVVATRRRVPVSFGLEQDLSTDLSPYLEGTRGLDEEERVALESILESRRRLSDVASRAAALHVRMRETSLRADEIRSSIRSLEGAAPAVRRRLSRTLEQAMADLEAVSSELARLRAEEADARNRLRAALREVSISS